MLQDNQMRERDRLEKSRSAKDAQRAERKRKLDGDEEGSAPVYASKREAKNRYGWVPLDKLKALDSACPL